MNPLALMMSRGMQPVPPDYAMPGPAPDMQTANAMAAAPAAIAQMPAAQQPGTDMEIVDFIESLKPFANQLPPELKLKFDKLQMRTRDPQGYPDEINNMQGAPSDMPPGSENWNEAQWDEWEEEQDRLHNQDLQGILRNIR